MDSNPAHFCYEILTGNQTDFEQFAQLMVTPEGCQPALFLLASLANFNHQADYLLNINRQYQQLFGAQLIHPTWIMNSERQQAMLNILIPIVNKNLFLFTHHVVMQLPDRYQIAEMGNSPSIEVNIAKQTFLLLKNSIEFTDFGLGHQKIVHDLLGYFPQATGNWITTTKDQSQRLASSLSVLNINPTMLFSNRAIPTDVNTPCVSRRHLISR